MQSNAQGYQWKWPGVFNSQTSRSLTEWHAWNTQLLSSLKDLEEPEDPKSVEAWDRDICTAIVWAFSGDQVGINHKKDRFDYTVRDLASWVRRKTAHDKRYKAETSRRKSSMDMLKERISMSDDAEEIWLCICDAPEDDDCHKLLAFAKRIHPGFTPPESRRQALKDVAARAIAMSELKTDKGMETSERFLEDCRERWPEYCQIGGQAVGTEKS